MFSLTDKARSCLLLQSYKSAADSAAGTDNLWLPHTKCQEHESTLEAAGRLLAGLEGLEDLEERVKGAQLVRIHSTRLLPLAQGHEAADARVIYLLCETR